MSSQNFRMIKLFNIIWQLIGCKISAGSECTLYKNIRFLPYRCDDSSKGRGDLHEIEVPKAPQTQEMQLNSYMTVNQNADIK